MGSICARTPKCLGHFFTATDDDEHKQTRLPRVCRSRLQNPPHLGQGSEIGARPEASAHELRFPPNQNDEWWKRELETMVERRDVETHSARSEAAAEQPDYLENRRFVDEIGMLLAAYFDRRLAAAGGLTRFRTRRHRMIDNDTTRFSIRFDPWYAVLSSALLLRPADSYVEVREGEVECRMGWAFRTRFPLPAVAGAARIDHKPTSRGVHGFAGRWLVNGAASPVVAIDLEPEQRARVLGVPVRLRQLLVSVDDADALAQRLKTA